MRRDEGLRVALVHPFSWPEVRRGGERYLDDLAWYLTGRGHAVDVITGTTGERAVEERGLLVVRRLPHVVRPRLERRGISRADLFAFRALRELRRRSYDLVHALMPTAALASRLARHRTLFTVLGHPTPDQFGIRPFDATLYRRALRAATVTAALSGASARATHRLLGVEPIVLPPGVRLAEFPAELSPRSGPARILYSADASDPRKGIDLVLDALPRVLDVRPDARLMVSGAGKIAPALDRLEATRERVAAAVDDLGAGSLEEVPGRYRGATVTVLPSRHEAFGLALVESLASGTPVICTDDGGMPEIVDDPAIGRVVPCDDPAALAQAIIEVADLARDPATPERCRRHAERWGWEEAVGPMHEEVYRGIVGR